MISVSTSKPLRTVGSLGEDCAQEQSSQADQPYMQLLLLFFLCEIDSDPTTLDLPLNVKPPVSSSSRALQSPADSESTLAAIIVSL